MPISILLRLSDEKNPPALTFDGRRVVIGRGPSSDVRVPDPSVSLRHATIQVDAGEHSIIDEGSTNGTFIGGTRLAPGAPRVLRSGDLVRVGRVWLQVTVDQTPATRDLSIATRDLAMALVSQAMAAMGEDVSPRIRVLEGKDRGACITLDDEGRAYIVGRGTSCDLPLEEADASREHVQITRRGSTILVRDLESKNGVFLGESRVMPGREVAWKASSMIRIGATVIALEEPVATALTQLEQVADEQVKKDDIPPVPKTLASPGAHSKNENGAPSFDAPPASAAPIASVDKPVHSRPPPSSSQGRSTFAPTDLLVVAVAIAIIATSIGGLVWLLRS
ncbi:MAG: FHA domain-containing protein [Polyangiaceae bacterium]